MTTQLSKPNTIESMLASPQIRQRFNEMLGQRAPQFISSIITVYRGFSSPVDPASVIASAAIAATLDLPIEKNLGFAHIVPYAGVAQFQMGAKGLTQLALRSNQYSGMNAVAINAECFGGYDNIGDPIIRWDLLDETKEAIGYVFAWRLTSGFSKTVYWPKAKVVAHAERFSQAYKKKKADSPWMNNFDAMALKTVIANSLRRWGILSVQMQTAFKYDQAIIKNIDAEPQYEDDIPFGPATTSKLISGGKKTRKQEPQEPTEPEQPISGEGSDESTAGTPAPIAPGSPDQLNGPGVVPLEHGDSEDANEVIRIIMANARELGIEEKLLMMWSKAAKLASEKQSQLSDLATHKLKKICEQWPAVVKEITGKS
jgi:recombination protein RecT